MSSTNSHSSALSTPPWLRTGEVRDDVTQEVRDDVARLFVTHREEIQWYIAHVHGSGFEAEELTQEVFLRLYREQFAGRRVDTPRVWLFRVARNMAIDHLRRGRQQMRLIDRSSVPPDTVADAAPNGEETLLSPRAAARPSPARLAS
jgi:RNA polymerase sigma-70 factor (ECF subfamily)